MNDNPTKIHSVLILCGGIPTDWRTFATRDAAMAFVRTELEQEEYDEFVDNGGEYLETSFGMEVRVEETELEY